MPLTCMERKAGHGIHGIWPANRISCHKTLLFDFWFSNVHVTSCIPTADGLPNCSLPCFPSCPILVLPQPHFCINTFQVLHSALYTACIKQHLTSRHVHEPGVLFCSLEKCVLLPRQLASAKMSGAVSTACEGYTRTCFVGQLLCGSRGAFCWCTCTVQCSCTSMTDHQGRATPRLVTYPSRPHRSYPLHTFKCPKQKTNRDKQTSLELARVSVICWLRMIQPQLPQREENAPNHMC
jgi:hypothetical protein